MEGVDWNEFLVVGLLAICVLGPICVVLLTQNLLDSNDDISVEHYNFENNPDPLAEKKSPVRPAERADEAPPPNDRSTV